MLDLAGGDALNHRHIDVRLGAAQRRPVGLQKEAGQEERGALVAVGSGWLRAKRSSRIAAFSKIVG